MPPGLEQRFASERRERERSKDGKVSSLHPTQPIRAHAHNNTEVAS